MEFTKKQPAFIYLDKNGFYYFDATLPSVISLAFLDGSVRDMDVINGATLLTQIKSFIDQYKLAPANISLVLSPNVTFEKDLIGLIPDQKEEAVKNFIDTIPFESVIAKEYPIDKGVKIIGCNEDIYSELKSSFEKSAFSIDMIVPFQMLGEDQTFIRNLTIDNAQQLVKRLDRLKQVSMIALEKEKTPSQQSTPAVDGEKPKKNNIRLFAMAGIFGVLFIILGFMIMNMK